MFILFSKTRLIRRNWSLRVVAIGFGDQEGDDNDSEMYKHQAYSFLWSEFKRLYLPLMEEFEKKWFGPLAHCFYEDERVSYLFILESTRNMLRHLEEIDETYPVSYLIDSPNRENGNNIKFSLFGYRKAIFDLKKKIAFSLLEFRIEFQRRPDPEGRNSPEADIFEFFRIEKGIRELLYDVRDIENG